MSNESQSMMLPVQIQFKKIGEYGYQCGKCPFLREVCGEPSHCTLFNREMRSEYVCDACSDFIWKSLRLQREEEG